MRRKAGGLRLGALVTAVASALWMAPPAVAAGQNDAGSGRDAGNTFDEATPILPRGLHHGRLDGEGGDRHDYFKFSLREGDSVSVLIGSRADTTDPLTLLDPNGNVVDVGTRLEGTGVTVSSVLTSEVDTVRLAIHRAAVAGHYRLHLQSDEHELGEYRLCFMSCEGPRDAHIETDSGSSLETTDARVLLVPPSHGDLGNPLGPTVVDYLDASLRGIHAWTGAMDAFADDYPQFAYLRDIEINVEVFDGAHPVDPVGYDVIVGYAAAGPVVRGVFFDTGTKDSVDLILEQVGLREEVRYSGRVVALSLFGSSPRVGQVMYDFPEVNDLENVTTHEFGHAFGLGHTQYWHPKLGPDLMNSPAPFVYGDGAPFGDGGERTEMECLSSLDLYAMALLYRWIPSGEWQSNGGHVTLPRGIPYRWYC